MEIVSFIEQSAVTGFGIAFLLSCNSDNSTIKPLVRKISYLSIILVYTLVSGMTSIFLPSTVGSILAIFIISLQDKMLSGKKLPDAFSNALVNYTLNIFSVIISAVVVYGMFYVLGFKNNKIILFHMTLICKIVIIIAVGIFIKKFEVQRLLAGKYIKIGISLLCVGIIIATQGFRITGVLSPELAFGLFLFVVIMFSIMAVVWLVDKREQLSKEDEMKKHEEEMKKHEEEMKKDQEEMQEKNKNLSGIVHKTREIFPSIAIRLRYLEENAADSKELTGELQELRKDIEILSNDQAKEDRIENRKNKTFTGSGNSILDGLFQNKLDEAAQKDIDFDIIVRNPVDGLVKNHNISNLALARLVGDLLSNAIYALTQTDVEEKSLFLCIGRLNEKVYELAVHDNANPFPVEVLKNLGERGFTSHPENGGSGNGMADVMQAVDMAGASFCLEEYLPEEGLFTKCISVCFDNSGHKIIKTDRKEELGEIENFVVM